MTRILPVLALMLSLVGSIPIVHAQSAATLPTATVAEEDKRAAQDIVRAQLAAFASDDADKAFSFASPSIRQMFGNAAQFMRMVRGSYPAVYRPAAVVFLKPELSDDALVQPVHLTDRTGSTWLAVYQLQRQTDKTWRIAGCVLLPRAGQTA